MKKGFTLLAVVMFVICFTIGFATSSADATEYQVKLDGTGDFVTIQDAIDRACDGDTIVVQPGTYYENIRFDGKNIVLASEVLSLGLVDYEPNPFVQIMIDRIVGSTIIDGQRNGTSTVRFTGTEDSTCELIGFTVTNGYSTTGGGGIRGANDCNGYYGRRWYAHALIRYCCITGNFAAIGGGGISEFAGLLDCCTVSWNGAPYGGGLGACDIELRNCTVANHRGKNDCGNDTGAGGEFGGGFWGCTVRLVGANKMYNNEAVCGGLFHYSTIRGYIDVRYGDEIDDYKNIDFNIANNNWAEEGSCMFGCTLTHPNSTTDDLD